MGDVGEAFNERRQQSKKKRANNRDFSRQLLESWNIPFTSHNIGAHLVVEMGDELIDFWPGTGLWMPRGTKKKQRGVKKLITYITNQKDATSDENEPRNNPQAPKSEAEWRDQREQTSGGSDASHDSRPRDSGAIDDPDPHGENPPWD